MTDSFQTSLKPCVTWHGLQARVNGKTAGYLTTDEFENVIYVTPRNRERHFFRNFRGWGISSDLVNDLITRRVDFIWFKVMGEATQQISLRKFLTASFEYQNPAAPRDFQRVVAEAECTPL